VATVSQLEVAASWGVTTLLDMGNKDLANLATLKTGTSAACGLGLPGEVAPARARALSPPG
jgi:hypothetical protein